MAHTILIVDDSQTSVPELRIVLDAEGFNILTALSGEEALDTLKMAKVDLIITEALLPRMDGFEFVRQVRRNDAWQQLPIIMLSVRSAPEDFAQSMEAGADDYFIKPMEPPKLIAVTRGWITRSEVARQQALSGTGRDRRPSTSSALATRNERGTIIAVFSLKGGVGTSTIAVNLAVAIKQLAPSVKVGLIDLSLEEGLDAMLLDIVPTSTIVDWAREDLSEATPYLLNQYFVQHRTGISLMAAPPSPEQAETVRPDVIRTTLKLAPDAFDYIVLDTASTFSEGMLTALEQAHVVLLPVTPDMAALKTAVNTKQILKAVKINEDKIRVVINEIIPRAGLSKQQVEQGLGKQAMVIPHAGAQFIDACNHGTPLVTLADQPPAARAIMDIARTFVEPESTEAEGAKENRAGILSRLRRA